MSEKTATRRTSTNARLMKLEMAAVRNSSPGVIDFVKRNAPEYTKEGFDFDVERANALISKLPAEIGEGIGASLARDASVIPVFVDNRIIVEYSRRDHPLFERAGDRALEMATETDSDTLEALERLSYELYGIALKVYYERVRSGDVDAETVIRRFGKETEGFMRSQKPDWNRSVTVTENNEDAVKSLDAMRIALEKQQVEMKQIGMTNNIVELLKKMGFVKPISLPDDASDGEIKQLYSDAHLDAIGSSIKAFYAK